MRPPIRSDLRLGPYPMPAMDPSACSAAGTSLVLAALPMRC